MIIVDEGVPRVQLIQTIEALWSIIDDIDTYSDMAKNNNELYRNCVERKQNERWRMGVACNGYDLRITPCVFEKKEEITSDVMRFNAGPPTEKKDDVPKNKSNADSA